MHASIHLWFARGYDWYLLADPTVSKKLEDKKDPRHLNGDISTIGSKQHLVVRSRIRQRRPNALDRQPDCTHVPNRHSRRQIQVQLSWWTFRQLAERKKWHQIEEEQRRWKALPYTECSRHKRGYIPEG